MTMPYCCRYHRITEAVNGGDFDHLGTNGLECAVLRDVCKRRGPDDSKGSLFDKAHLDITYRRQDDCNKQMADLVKFAGQYKSNPSTPAVLVSFMGDGMPAFMTALSKELEPLRRGVPTDHPADRAW